MSASDPRPRSMAALTCALALAACAAPSDEANPTGDGSPSREASAGEGARPSRAESADAGWIELFNGRDLSGWVPKVRGHATGEDPYGTFRVEDGLLTVGYEGYQGPFEDRFGHLFHERAFSSYELELEYRFVGEQMDGGPGWAWRNSGVMLHAQSPESMLSDQDFPISIEAQLLGGDGNADRPTANLCTPGTHVSIDGVLSEAHCVESTSPTFHGDVWVRVRLVVRGDASIVHLVEGDTVIAYERPVVGGGVVDGFDPEVKQDGTALGTGYIALQSESHPVQFRAVRIREIPGPAPGA